MIVFIVAIVLTAGAIFMLLRSGIARLLLDKPNHRSLHSAPTPKIGGVAVIVSATAALALAMPVAIFSAALALAACLMLVSFVDDRKNLPAALRLAVQLTAAVAIEFVWRTLYLRDGELNTATSPWLNLPWRFIATALLICWITNLFNFMDGADGMAGGMALIGFGAFAIAASNAAAPGYSIATIAAGLSGAALGFLFFNYPTARVFMGDAGSIPLGFLAATIAIEGNLAGIWPWWFGGMVFSPFIVDATVTLLKRLLQGKRIWMAHREHYYQRLILTGWSHRRTVNSYYVLMLGSAISALAAQNGNHLFPLATFWVITYLSLLLYLEWRFYQQEKDKTEKNPEAK